VAVKVTLCHSLDEEALEATVVVVEAAVTVTARRCDKLPAKVPSPV